MECRHSDLREWLLHGLDSADNFRNFLRDLALTSAVVADATDC